jgi:hypothetical protein
MIFCGGCSPPSPFAGISANLGRGRPVLARAVIPGLTRNPEALGAAEKPILPALRFRPQCYLHFGNKCVEKTRSIWYRFRRKGAELKINPENCESTNLGGKQRYVPEEQFIPGFASGHLISHLTIISFIINRLPYNWQRHARLNKYSMARRTAKIGDPLFRDGLQHHDLINE